MDRNYDLDRIIEAFRAKVAMSESSTSPWGRSAMAGIPPRYYTDDRSYAYMFKGWEPLNNIAYKVDVIPEEYVESEEIGEFLDGFKIKEAS